MKLDRLQKEVLITKHFENKAKPRDGFGTNLTSETKDGNFVLIYRDKYNMLWTITINHLDDTVLSNLPLPKDDLKFFDGLGYNLSKEHTEKHNQEIEDWFK